MLMGKPIQTSMGSNLAKDNEGKCVKVDPFIFHRIVKNPLKEEDEKNNTRNKFLDKMGIFP